MTQPNAPAGWYPDPTGRHESRYFNGQWTQHVSTRGVTSIDPLGASPASAANMSFSTSPGTPYVPAVPNWPSAPQADLHTAPGATQRSPMFKLAIAGGVAAVAAGVTIAVALSGGGGSGGHGYCADAISLNEEYPSAAAITDISQISQAASKFDALAAESPSPQDAADLRYLARFMRNLLSGNNAAVLAGQAKAAAAAERFDAYASRECSRPVGGG
jgi:hypothetical protein